jgi:hypothetical protein
MLIRHDTTPYDMTLDRVFQVENTVSQDDNELRVIYRSLQALIKSDESLNEKIDSLKKGALPPHKII